MKVSIILPVLNEARHIEATLEQLRRYREQGHEVIVVDGGSRDGTLELAHEHADSVLVSNRGRALQMNAGALSASGDVLLFLHADTMLPPNACERVEQALSEGKLWGRFNVRLSGEAIIYRLIATLMNWRSCLTSIATGDQAMFVSRELFESAGGFPEISLMEDIAMSKILRRQSRCACIRQRVITSSRRWQNNGVLRTIVLMWQLRLLYFLGVSPDVLANRYYRS